MTIPVQQRGFSDVDGSQRAAELEQRDRAGTFFANAIGYSVAGSKA